VIVERVATSELPTRFGEFTVYGYRGFNNEEYLVLTKGEPNSESPAVVRIHSACLTGDVFNSLRCDCGKQLTASLKGISEAPVGVLIYAYNHEGRGVGLLNKLRAYQLQDSGLDTVDANKALGFEKDHREYVLAAEILKDLGVTKVKLLTNNPSKIESLKRRGLEVERVPLWVDEHDRNSGYLQTKRQKLGHLP
jgi:3,4-dihydroxy 2-butanone 4-phosphate synthase/GTP cyclohydrolase II